MTVTIGFQSPTAPSDGATIHERKLTAVPPYVAQQMTNDFAKYRTSAPEAEQYKMYNYVQSGRERHIPLDFGEISTIEVSREGSSDQTIAQHSRNVEVPAIPAA